MLESFYVAVARRHDFSQAVKQIRIKISPPISLVKIGDMATIRIVKFVGEEPPRHS